MSIFDFLRRPETPSTQQDTPAPDQPVALAAGTAVASGLTVEMKLRGRHSDGGPDNLQSAENRLAELQTRYRLGQYSGHPEEMLEDIEFAEMAVQRLRTS